MTGYSTHNFPMPEDTDHLRTFPVTFADFIDELEDHVKWIDSGLHGQALLGAKVTVPIYYNTPFPAGIIPVVVIVPSSGVPENISCSVNTRFNDHFTATLVRTGTATNTSFLWIAHG